jgi:phosphoribosylformylglycinamidine synthase subunit PurQ / glutaminase
MAKKPKVIIVRTAGTNCDQETAHAFKSLGASVDFIHINKLLKKEESISNYDLLMIPGGFSYGDDVAAGKVLANELKFKLYEDINNFVKSGKLVFGICNGFQVLVKCGLLPGFETVDKTQHVTLAFNNSDKFEARWIYLKRARKKSPFLDGVPEIIKLPIAHGEGKFITKDKEILEKIEKDDQVVFRYVDETGKFGNYPINPNGSLNHIAGICNKEGNVFGMMPHPERFFNPYQDPNWTSGKIKKYGDGFYIFKSAVEYMKSM